MIKSLWMSAAVFIAGFAICCVAIHAVVGDPLNLYAEQRSEKLAVLAQQGKDNCSAIFGSSHIHNGFDPRVFDHTLRSFGVPVSSVNLAIEGGSQTEQFAMAKEFLRSRDARSFAGRCVMVLEINAGANFQDRHLVHPRSINIYDDEVARVGASFVAPDMSAVRKLGRLAFVAAATVMHYLNVGTLASRLFPHADDTQLISRETADDRRGLLSEPANPRDTAAVQEMFRAVPKEAQASAAQLTHGSAELVSTLRRQPRGASVEFVYLVSPKLDDLTHYETYPPCMLIDGKPVSIINVAQPGKYPALYRPELWHDPTHLNAEGAAVFTGLAAQVLGEQETMPLDPSLCVSV